MGTTGVNPGLWLLWPPKASQKYKPKLRRNLGTAPIVQSPTLENGSQAQRALEHLYRLCNIHSEPKETGPLWMDHHILSLY